MSSKARTRKSEKETRWTAPKARRKPKGGELVETAWPTAVATRSSESAERTDDPVRMYQRDGLGRAPVARGRNRGSPSGIEAGREAMIAGLCESPLTFQAIIIISSDELNDAKILLRDIIDPEATYAGPDGKKATPKTDYSAPGAPPPPNPARDRMAFGDQRRRRQSRKDSKERPPRRPTSMKKTTWRIPSRCRRWRRS